MLFCLGKMFMEFDVERCIFRDVFPSPPFIVVAPRVLCLVYFPGCRRSACSGLPTSLSGPPAVLGPWLPGAPPCSAPRVPVLLALNPRDPFLAGEAPCLRVQGLGNS